MIAKGACRAGVCIFLLVTCSAFSQTQLSAEKRTQVEAAVAKFMASTHVPGLSVAVVEKGEYEWGQGFGLADVENNVAATEHTLFRLGSISKPLTAVGTMQIWERGQVDLDAPVQKYCPSFSQRPSPFTAREVSGPRGGIQPSRARSQ